MRPVLFALVLMGNGMVAQVPNDLRTGRELVLLGAGVVLHGAAAYQAMGSHAAPLPDRAAVPPIDRVALDGSGPAHAAITPDGSRIFTTRGERIVVWSLDAAKVGPPPAAPPPETTRSE